MRAALLAAYLDRPWPPSPRGTTTDRDARGELVVIKPHAVSNTQPAATDPNAAVP
jgi:hypothetical protein